MRTNVSVQCPTPVRTGVAELLLDVLAGLSSGGVQQCANGEHASPSLLLLGPPGVGVHGCLSGSPHA